MIDNRDKNQGIVPHKETCLLVLTDGIDDEPDE